MGSYVRNSNIYFMGNMDEIRGVYYRMTAMIYKWYIYLRKQGYGRMKSLYCACYNTRIREEYWTKELYPGIPQPWIDKRERYYRG